jgi:hypothetical protein
MTEVNGVNHRIAANPLRFPVIYRDARKASRHGFPYVVIFRLIGEEARLLAFIHTSRNPGRWRAGAQFAQLTGPDYPMLQSAAAMYGRPRRRPSASMP